MTEERKSITQKVEEMSTIESKNVSSVQGWCPTGCTVLDLAIANQYPGGIPIGRIVHLYGGASTCKTVLATTICGYAQRTGKMAYYADIERTFDPAFAEIYGLDSSDEKSFLLGYQGVSGKTEEDEPETLEEFFDDWLKKVVESNVKKDKVIVVDTITVLPAKIEQDKKMEEQGYGAYRAKQISLGLRKYIKKLADSNATLICIDQTRDNVGSFIGGEITTGGRGLEFYSSVRLYLKHDNEIVKTVGKVTKKVGIWVKFKVQKNKVGPPFREGRFRILFDYGLDDVASNLYFISEYQNGRAAANKLSTKIKLFDDEKTINAWIKYIEDNNLEKELQKEVWKLWQEIYKTEERKTRVW